MTVWDRPEPAGKPVPLDRAQIVAAAIALADEGGLDEVSFRKVAARLKAGPMRLYGFFDTKQDLLDLMVDEVQGEMLATEPPGDWRTALAGIAHRTREAVLRHEWLADLLGGRPALGPNGLALTEARLAALDGHAGIDTARRAIETVSDYVLGAIRREVANRRAEQSKDEWRRSNSDHVTRMLATGRFPALEKFVHDSTDVDPATAFTTGLDWVLDAVAAKLSATPG